MPIAEFIAVNLDCADPTALARFYAELTGVEIAYSSEEYAGITIPDVVTIYCQKVADHRPPTWPDSERPQQSHLDFSVADLDQAEAAAIKLGASRPDFQPGGEKWRVLADPAGHPICLCLRS
ncbi:MAG: VOC family protein [Jatrophihabitans sp.]